MSQELEGQFPEYLEWSTWRSFLAINEIVSPIHETRRFSVDEDFLPRNPAPGGGSDLIFEFASYVLVVEVTLTISSRQMSVEIEPVLRHLVKYKNQYPQKETYCLFIAPTIDNNIAQTFLSGKWYEKEELHSVNVIPMTISDYISAFDTFLKSKFKNTDFKNLLDRCLTFRNQPVPQWKTSISKEIGEWKKRI